MSNITRNCLVLLVAAIALPSHSLAQTPASTKRVVTATKSLTVDDILSMVNAGLSDDIIIAKLHKQNQAFDLSPDDLLRLKEETSRLSEIVRAYVLQCYAESCQGRIGRFGVGRIGSYENIEIFGKTGLRMKDDGVTAHDEVLNSMGMEGGQKVFVVLVHPVRFSNL